MLPEEIMLILTLLSSLLWFTAATNFTYPLIANTSLYNNNYHHRTSAVSQN